VHVLKLATFCKSEAEFVGQFKAFLDEDTLFLPSKFALAVGQIVEFSICLQNERPMLEGRGEVVNVRAHVGGKGARSGLRVRVQHLTAASRSIKEAILGARGAPGATPPAAKTSTALVPATVQPSPSPLASNGKTPDGISPRPARTTLARLATTSRAAAASDAPAVGPASPAPSTNRLVTQRMQPLLPANAPPPGRLPDEFESEASSPSLEVSTGSIVSSIESNLTPVTKVDQPAQLAPLSAPPHDESLTDTDTDLDMDLADELPVERRLTSVAPLARHVAAPLLSSLATLAVCWFAWGSSAAPPPASQQRATPIGAAVRVATPAAAPPVKAPPIAARAAAAAASPTIEPTPAPSPSPAPAPPPPAPVSAQCKARITSAPSHALVSLGEHDLGVTPLDADQLPCARVEVTLTRPRYSVTTATLLPDRSGKVSVSVRLARPPGHLVLTSTPANAVFKVNRVAVSGPAPEVTVLRYERSRIEATLPGHRPWKKTVYVTAASMNVNAVLIPARHRGSARSARK
jgi:PEGA domain